MGVTGLICLVAVAATAEDLPLLVPGARVRVGLASGGSDLIGRLLAVGDGELTLQPEGDTGPRSVRRGEIAAVEVSAG